MLGGGLKQAGWKEVIPNDHSDEKNHTYGHSTFMIAGGQRGGPLTTYLVSASQRKNFALWTNTIGAKLIREGARVTGVQLECNGDGGHSGVVSLTPNTGRVIVSAGSFGSAKLLFRSKSPRLCLPWKPGVCSSKSQQLTACRRHRAVGSTEHCQELDRRTYHDWVRLLDQPTGWLQPQRSRWRKFIGPSGFIDAKIQPLTLFFNYRLILRSPTRPS